MNIDGDMIFSEDQALVATADSTNILRLSDVTIGSAGPLWLVAVVTESFATATTYSLALQDSADGSSFAAIAKVAIITPAVAVATLVAGYTWVKVPLPDKIREYVKLVYTEVGSTATAGKVTAFLTTTPDAAL